MISRTLRRFLTKPSLSLRTAQFPGTRRYFSEEREQEISQEDLDEEFRQAESFDPKTLIQLVERAYRDDELCMNHFLLLEKQIDELYSYKLKNLETEATLQTFQDVNERNKEKLGLIKEAYEKQVEETKMVHERGKKEADKEREFAISKFSKDILDTFDNLERAMAEASEEEKETTLYKGIELTFNSGMSTLKRFGITPIESEIGEIFNPQFHDVMFDAPVPGKEAGEIMHVVVRGYMIGERVLRAAKVGVVRD